jgi:hemerythrin superfamily protein
MPWRMVGSSSVPECRAMDTDIYTYIRKDHRRVEDLIDQLFAVRLPSVRQYLFNQICEEVTLHNESEQRTFYAAIEAAAAQDDVQRQMHHCEHEHAEIHDLLDVIANTPISSEFWLEKFGEFKQALHHHVEEEERDVFERAKIILTPDQARQLARDMDTLKRQLRQTVPVAAE